MKHLVAILAHKNPQHLALLIEECQSRGYEVIVHLDAKVKAKITSKWKTIDACTIEPSIDVQRAHFSIVQATMHLIQEAQHIEYDYFHLLSGEDYITKSSEEFEEFFTKNNGKNFINHLLMPVKLGDDEYDRAALFSTYSIFRDCVPPNNYQYWTIDGGLGFINRYYFSPNNWKSKLINKISVSYRVRKIMTTLLRRKTLDTNSYTGSAWFSVTKDLTQYWLEQWNSDLKTRRFFKNVLFPDEIYLQTLAANSPYAPTLINSDLRYINWDHPVNHGPSILDVSHLDEIRSSNGFFARKIDVSDKVLLKAIHKKLYKC